MNDTAEPREPGENFQFIAQVTDLFSPKTKQFDEIIDKVNLIATAGKFGLIFVSDQEYVVGYETCSLLDHNNVAPVVTIAGRGKITHISTSCESQTLSVISIVNEAPFLFLYDIFALISNSSAPSPFYTAPLSSVVNTRVTSVAWNPADQCCVAIALSNGDMSVLKIKETSMELSSLKAINATVVTWSAKGKQLAIGKSDGTVSLFKPDLTPVRDIQRPPVQELGAIIDITWFTNMEFFIGYLINNSRPVLYYVNAPKGKQASFYTFEDVCYSSERDGKPVTYYTYFISEWNLLFVLSSHGVEMGVVGRPEPGDADGCQWCQWFPDDGARASMNFRNVVQETFPLGFAVDFTTRKTFPAKDEQTRGPFPALLSLSTGGELNAFFIENKLAEKQDITIPRETIPSTGHRTPEQYGQRISGNLIPDSKPANILQLNVNAPSAFSSVPKHETSVSSKPFSFSSLKPQMPPVASAVGETTASNISVPLSRPTLSFPTPFVPKPVSISNEVGVSSNLSKTLHVPSPKKSLGPPFGMVPLMGSTVSPSTALSPHTQMSSQLTLVGQPSASPSTKPIDSIASPLPPAPVSAAPKVTTQQLFYLLKEETEQFEKELLDNSKSNETLQYQVGTDDENEKTAAELVRIKKWMMEMKKTTGELNDELSQLHEDTLEALASYEDANSHKDANLNSKNQMYMMLRPLDPYSQRRMREIRYRYHYLVSQISEVNAKIDLQWDEYSTLKKSKSLRKTQESTEENLYRSVLNLHKSRVCFEKRLEEACQQLKKLCLNHLDFSSGSAAVASVESDLRSSPFYSQRTSQAEKMTKLSPKKTAHLREILSQRVVTPIRDRTAGISRTTRIARNLEEELNEQNSILSEYYGKPSLAESYEDISPPSSPEKGALSITTNPLAALSTLVGKVSHPDDKKNPSIFSFTNTSTGKNAITFHPEASKAISIQGVGLSAFNRPSVSTDHNVKSFQVAGASSSFGLSSEQKISSGFSITQSSVVPKTAVTTATSLLTMFQMNQSGVSSSSAPAGQPLFANLKEAFVKVTAASNSETSVGVQPEVQSAFNVSVSSKVNKEIPSFFKSISSDTDSDLKDSEALDLSDAIKDKQIFVDTVSRSEPNKSALDSAPTFGISSISVNQTLSVPTGGSFSLLGQPTTAGSLFVAKTSPSSSSIFGQATNSVSSGLQPVPTTSSVFVFGQPVFNSSSSIFGQQNITSSSSKGLLSQPVNTSSSLFAKPGSSNSSSLFTQPAATSSSIIVQPGVSSSSSLTSGEVASVSSPVSDEKSVISSSASIFGRPSTPSLSVFGESTNASSLLAKTSIFGQAVTISTSAPAHILTSNSSVLSQSISSSLVPSSSSLSTSLLGQPAHANVLASVFQQPVSSNLSTVSGQVTSTSTDVVTSLSGDSGSILSTENGVEASVSVSTAESKSSSLFGLNLSPSSTVFGQPVITSITTTLSEGTSMTLPSVTAGKVSQSTSDNADTSLDFEQTTSSSAVPLFGGCTTSAAESNPQTALPNLSSLMNQQTTASSIFGHATSGGSSMFAQPTSTSLFGHGSLTRSSLFEPGTTSSSVFLTTAVTSATSGASGFGSPATASIFGSPATTSTASLFGSQATSTASLFGSPATTATASVFAAPATTSTASVFGSPVKSSTASIFGSPATTAAASMFGSPATSATASIFGSPAATSEASIFGSSATTSAASVFASPATSSTASVFGSPVTTSVASVFGSPATTSAASIFGSPATTSAASIFRSPATTSAASIFGSPATTSTASIFGSPSANSIFGGPASSSASIFGNVAPSSQSVFGNVVPTTKSIFGSAFGQTASTTTSASSAFTQPAPAGSIFGQPSPTSTSIFGGKSEGGGAPPFGGFAQSGTSIFGGANSTTTSSAFGENNSSSSLFSGGGLFGGLGKAPNPENASKNVFGSVPGGQSAPQASIFGSGGSSSIFGSSPSSGSPLSQNRLGGAFSPVKSSAPTFGGNPVFGGSPTFGSDVNNRSSVFGSSAGFGNSPGFGAPTGGTSFGDSSFGTFGSGSSAPEGFSSFANTGGTTFGSLASQGSDSGSSFGQLAQQSNTNPLGNVPLSGSSFTSWR